jgi:hypothetical protein
MPKTFHIGDVLSVTTGKLISLNHMLGVHELLEYMMGHGVFTHQLPRAGDACEPCLLQQFPWLSDLQVPVERLVLKFQEIRSWGTSEESKEKAIKKALRDWFATLDSHPAELDVLSISELKEAN